MNFRSNLLIAILIIMISGCVSRAPLVPPTPQASLSRVDASAIDFTDDLEMDSLDLAIERSIHYYESVGPNSVYRIADMVVDAGKMKESLLDFRRIIRSGVSGSERKKQIAQAFDVYRATGRDGRGSVLFTGYYVPLLEGALEKTEKYKYPIYRTPPELMNGKKGTYYSRREIDSDGALKGRGLEMIWVSDAADLFSLHIQGSGKIRLEDGRLLTVGSAQNNGRPYRPMPAEMLEEIRREKGNASYASVKAWLKSKNDRERNRILSYYERYIFFRFVNDPTGSLGEPVTPNRTIATDPDCFPQGALAFIRTRKSVLDGGYNVVGRADFSRFVLNQDKGSAIKGPGRVDLFCGYGPAARAVAGNLKEPGELYFLIKKR